MGIYNVPWPYFVQSVTIGNSPMPTTSTISFGQVEFSNFAIHVYCIKCKNFFFSCSDWCLKKLMSQNVCNIENV